MMKVSIALARLVLWKILESDIVLIPISLLLGAVGLAAFLWSIRSNQYDDMDGHANRILSDRYDDSPEG